MRKSREYERIIHSIEQNPVTAGLVTSAALRPWSGAGWQAKPPAPPTSDLSLKGRNTILGAPGFVYGGICGNQTGLNGNITTDENGDATIKLPEYFEALNQDFRYQLTAIGQFAQAIVASEIKDNQFSIKTDKPRVKVSWQVTGIRHDAFANANRIQVEEVKPAKERGFYLHPELFGQPEEKRVEWALTPETMRRIKEQRAQVTSSNSAP